MGCGHSSSSCRPHGTVKVTLTNATVSGNPWGIPASLWCSSLDGVFRPSSYGVAGSQLAGVSGRNQKSGVSIVMGWDLLVEVD